MTAMFEATYRVPTPLFCGGADHEAELRLPSFKGVLRFWWRALAWREYSGDLQALREAEDRLFGSAQRGQSRVNLRLLSRKQPGLRARGQVLRTVGDGARYLGYGLMEAFASNKKKTKAGQLLRPCFLPGLEFTVALRCRGLSESDLDGLARALKCLGLLGGLGARSRRGYGSLTLQGLAQDKCQLWKAPADLPELSSELSQFLGGPSELPEITALSGRSRVVLVTAAVADPVDLLDRVGREMLRFRSWGHNGKVLGGDSEKLFKDDHDLMKRPLETRHHHPRRIAFGLPHNYGRWPEQQVGPAGGGLDRRASPLFLHIHEGGRQPIAVVALLPARFLPDGHSDISVGYRLDRNRRPVDHQIVPLGDPEELYKPLNEFLDRLLAPGQRREPFTEAQEVKKP